MESKHVPAWKRIGLKLKYANENPEPTAVSAATQKIESQNETKRPAQDVEAESRPAKKRKSSSVNEDQPSGINGHSSENATVIATTESSAVNGQILQTPEKAPANSRNRRKSVTFTPDTKAEDGFTGQAYFKGWAANQRKEQTNVEEPSAEQQQSSEPEQTPAEKKLSKKEKKQAKQQQKAKSDSASTGASSTPREVPDYVHYLTQFHTDQANWKFNKRKQNDLLKNALNLWRIPVEHNDALIAYVSGLQGAAAQQRLLDDAENVLREFLERNGRLSEIDGMNDRRARNAVYEAQLKRDHEQDEESDSTEEIQKRQQKEIRAEAILQELLPKELRPIPKAKPAATQAPVVAVAPSFGQPVVTAAPTHMRFDDEAPLPPMKKDAPKKRTRKSRTDVSSSSSSDESSSDESSSDSDNDSEVETPVAKKTKKDVKAKKSTSASASSDSSESEEDSSSESDSSSDSDED